METLNSEIAGTLARTHDLALVVLFGSRARAAAKPDSDTDVAVMRSDGQRLSFRQLAALNLALSDIVGGDVDVVDLTTPDALVRFNVAADGQVLFAGSRQHWTGFVAQALIDHADIERYLDLLVAGVGRAARASQP